MNKEKTKKFDYKIVVRCNNCGDEIHSHYDGHFATCSCYDWEKGTGCAVDETEHYGRWIGSNFKLLQEDGTWVAPK